MKTLILTSAAVITTILLINKTTPTTTAANATTTNTPTHTSIERYEICPVVGDYKTQLASSQTIDSNDASLYTHCAHCNIGVYSFHDNETERKCTYCGKSE